MHVAAGLTCRIDTGRVSSSGLMDEKDVMEESNMQMEDRRGRLEALLPAYAIGATDAEETRFVEETLLQFPEMTAEVERYRALEPALLALTPSVAPPPGLAGNLHAAVMRERTPAPAAAPETRAQQAWRGWFAGSGLRWALGLAVAALLLFNGWSLVQNRMLQQQQATLLTQIAEQREAIGLLSDDAVNRTEIFGVVDDGEAKVSVIWNDAFSVAILYAEGLPQLRPDEVYHVWLIDGEERTCGGLFDVDQLGTGTLIIRLPDRLDRFSAIGITSEAADNTTAPTVPPIVRGPI